MSENDRKEKPKRTVGDVIRTVVIIIALGVFCYSGFSLFQIYQVYKAGTDEYQELEDFAKIDKIQEEEIQESTDAEGNQEKTMKSPVDFAGLKEINEEVIAWINIEALDVSYPVAQAKDNDYYLTHTFKKVDNIAGAIFMEYQSKKDFSDQNTLIYGHNMKNGSMFGTLKEFYKKEVYEKSPYFWVYTPNKNYKFEIFSCSEVGATSDSYQLTFATDKEYQDYIDKAKKNSVVDSKVEVTVKDHIATLSTCTANSETRFIVQGKLVETYTVEK